MKRFCAHLEELLRVDAMAPVGSIPHDLLCGLRVSAFCQAVAWWYQNGTDAAPEKLANWFVSAID